MCALANPKSHKNQAIKQAGIVLSLDSIGIEMGVLAIWHVCVICACVCTQKKLHIYDAVAAYTQLAETLCRHISSSLNAELFTLSASTKFPNMSNENYVSI